MPIIMPITTQALNKRLYRFSVFVFKASGIVDSNPTVTLGGLASPNFKVADRKIVLPAMEPGLSWVVCFLQGLQNAIIKAADDGSDCDWDDGEDPRDALIVVDPDTILEDADPELTVTVTSGGSSSAPPTPVPAILFSDSGP